MSRLHAFESDKANENGMYQNLKADRNIKNRITDN